jgi:soluble lytic murein transglycosylase
MPRHHFHLSLLSLLALLAPAAAADPRILLVELQLAGKSEEALRQVERLLAEKPDQARELGLHYLQGRLLLGMGRRQDASEAFAATMGATPRLSPFSRYQLACEQQRLGHPEVAAGLVATLLRSDPPRSLLAPAMRLLRSTIIEGGDCRLLRGFEAHRFRAGERRELTLALAACQARGDDVEAARRHWLQLLEEDGGDLVARLAAESLEAVEPETTSARVHLLIGLVYHQHREFDAAVHHLARAQVQLAGADLAPREVFELRYALARSHFWQQRYTAAAAVFAAIAADSADPRRRAQSLYQQARCYELAGRWDRAASHFRQTFNLDPGGGWADSALIAELRLAWRRGQEDAALAVLDLLLARRHDATASRALLFLASSDLAAGRVDRAGDWLRRAADMRRLPAAEIRYWQGRLAQLEPAPDEAVGHYLAALGADPYHPFGQAARQRLESPELAAAARREGRRLAESRRAADLYDAWLLLEDGDPLRARVRQALERQLAADPKAAPFLALDLAPVAKWPLWDERLERPEEMLLALGLFDEGGSMVLHYFPVAKHRLAFTGSLVLARTGDLRRSLYIAEILSQRVPHDLPEPLLPAAFRHLLYPAGLGPLIRAEGERRQVDPDLLMALIREESRFDPDAFSAAAARGLAQFVFSTARGVAARHGLGPVSPQDLDRPAIAIALAAAYLRELHDRFGGSLPDVVAAYNAGEPQAALWRRYCVSEEPEEYLSKVSFHETRNYLAKVLTSRAHYAELYGER